MNERQLAEAQVGRDFNDKVMKWVIGLLLSVILAGGTLYGKWITDSIHSHDLIITQSIQRESQRDENIDILNSKLDVIMHFYGLQYNGPAFKRVELPEISK